MNNGESQSLNERETSMNKLYFKLPNWLDLSDRQELSQLAGIVDWEYGRQGTGYEKSDIKQLKYAKWIIRKALGMISNPEQYDAWLIRCPIGSDIPLHVDPAVEGMCHVRLNALVNTGEGGLLFLGDEEQILSDGDAYVFRPDIIPHRVTAISSGVRLALSVGANIDYEQAHSIGLEK